MIRGDARIDALRTAIDRGDAGVAALAALRRRIVREVAACKTPDGGRDPIREARVRAHVVRVAADLGLPSITAGQLVDSLIRDACAQQGYSTDADHQRPDIEPFTPGNAMSNTLVVHLARWLPAPKRLSPVLRQVPSRWHARLMQHAMRHALADPVHAGEIEFLTTRTIGIEVVDLGLSWSIGLRNGALTVVEDPAEATVKGTMTDLMLLASRAEDADTLFFQRRLVLTGDTELGLLARNTLDRLDWERIPLGMRVLLHRAARIARDARAAWREAHAAGTAAHPGPPSQ